MPRSVPASEPRIDDDGVVERDGVRIEVSIESQLYTWTVTNLDAPPITSFEIAQKVMYNPVVPSGWEGEIAGATFHAWTADPARAIEPGASLPFVARVSSEGAIVDLVTARVGFAEGEGGGEVVVPGVWGTTGHPASVMLMIAGVLVGVGVLHAWMTRKRGSGIRD